MATLQQSIEWAKQNRADPRAKELYNAIVSGKMDSKALEEGIDLSPLKGSQIKPQVKIEERPLESFAKGFAKGELESIIKTARLVQKGGQAVLAVMDPFKTFEQIKEQTGFDVLKGKTAEEIDAILKSENTAEKAGKLAEFVAEIFFPVGKTTEAQKIISKGKEVIPAVIQKGKEIITKAPSKIKEKITGVVPKIGEKKITEDALTIAREPITKAYEEAAAIQQRTFKEGRLGEIKFKPTHRENLVADSIRPLVEQGRINSQKLPFENIPEIQLEINRINQGVGNMIRERKFPFNLNQLRSKLTAIKKDSEIIFTTDPTIEKTYDALIKTFLREVGKKDTFGLFQARQSFDKIPAVKKLLDSIKGAQGENLRRQAVLDIRRAVNEYIADLLPKNNPYQPLLRQESYMIEAISNLAEKSKGLGGTTEITRFLEQNPTLKYIIRQTIPFGAGAIIF